MEGVRLPFLIQPQPGECPIVNHFCEKLARLAIAFKTRVVLTACADEIRISVPDSDSGIFLWGQGKSQINIWCWPVGSGEVYGYRMDKSMPAEVRASVTPKVQADRDIGEWNQFEITMKGDRVSVKLNGNDEIASLNEAETIP